MNLPRFTVLVVYSFAGITLLAFPYFNKRVTGCLSLTQIHKIPTNEISVIFPSRKILRDACQLLFGKPLPPPRKG
jgi:hypothetical protein